MTPISASSLSRRYSLLVALLALPLLALVGVLGVYQFETQRRLELEALETDVSETKLVVERVVQDASDHLAQLKSLAEDLLSGALPPAQGGVRSLLAASGAQGPSASADGLSLDGIAGGPMEGKLGNALVAAERLPSSVPGELDMALALFEPTRLTHLVRPNLRWSYYFSASGAFITMFPFVSRQELVEGFGHVSLGAMIDHYLSYDVYLDVTPARNPEGAPLWTPPYLDAAGAGWMVSHAVPLFSDGRFAGVLGTDLLLSYLDDTLARLPLDAGGLWIVDPAGNLVADRAGTPVDGTVARNIRAALPAAFGADDAAMSAVMAPGRHRIAGHEVVAAGIAGTPWTLLFVVAEADLARIVATRIVPYGVVLVGLLFMILAAHYLLRAQFVRPAIALAEHLQAESRGDAPLASAPPLWRPWFARITSIFEEKRDSMRSLAGSEQRYRDVVEAQTDFVLRITPEGRFNFVNDAYCRYVRKSREELLDPGYNDFDAMHPDVRAEYLAHLARLTVDNPIATIELRRILPDGEIRWASWTDRAFFDASGNMIEIQSVGRDVTDQKRATLALAESEERFRGVVEAITEFVMRITLEGRVTFVNDAYCRHVGKTREELLSPYWNEFDLLPEREREKQLRYFAALTPENPFGTIELESTRSDGTTVYEEWTDRALFDDQGRLVEVQAVGRDITAKKLALLALAESEARYRNVVETQTEFIVRMRPDGKLTFVNDAYCRYHGRSREELLAPEWCEYDVLSEEERTQFLDYIGRLTPETPVSTIEMSDTVPGRPVRWSSWTDYGMFDADGRLVEIQSVGRDVTERVLAEQARQETERLRRTALEAALDGYVALDVDGRIIEFNAAAEAIFEYRREEVLGRPMAETLVPTDLRQKHNEAFKRHLATGETHILGRRIEVPALRRDGSVFPIELVIVRGTIAEKPVFIAYLRDLTEQKKAAAALAEREAQIRAITEGVPLSIIISAVHEPRVIFVNERAQQALGLRVGQHGAPVLAVWKFPEHRVELARRVEAEGVVDAFETTFFRPDGRELPALVSARRIEHEGRPAMLAAVTDITRQREAEAEIAIQREALHQSEKMTALGSLLAGVAHELNNPLSVVVGYSSMLTELSRDPAITDRAAKIHAAAERCSRIVRTFLAMARKRPPTRGAVNLNEVVSSALELAAYGLRSAGIQVETQLAPDLPVIWGDEDQMHQVVTNLVVNAQQALVMVEQPRRLVVSTREAGESVEVAVADNGPGIPDAVRARIFEPFFTTKAAGVGTGVGLSVCKAIVTAHEGEISAEGGSGAGTRIVVRLPRGAARAAAAEAAPPPAVDEVPLSLNVLVIDDEPDIAAMVAEMLRQDGHVAEIASDARAALRIIERADVDLIVSDLRMSDLDGPGLYRAIREKRPDLADRILFITGDVLAADIDQFLADTGAAVVEKPIDPVAFRRAVARRLDETQGEMA
ncbi:MAG: PAS domain S-box protein [Rhizobiaceae bacterium]|nr:MAG: PAS domain S-box protein [Rhizobiaceae bacterium]CAG1005305.1 Blue-light-activated protein [Rhizobiaceae bacterium]